ncbi:unnamed protein product [Hymenolepis diminuta]|uniref:PH domain-containing protein n=1 Tax=Hymenolepis diminuta TaxID=6216 RepID=A0A158QDD7_HYMDI|nr:unnamed protein product [Hymenolepis diminuta]
MKAQNSFEQANDAGEHKDPLLDSSWCSAPLNATQRPLAHSAHDLRFLEQKRNSGEVDLTSGDRRAVIRVRKGRQLFDSDTGRSHSECVPSKRSPSGNHLAVPASSISSSQSQRHSNSSPDSTECYDAAFRKPPEPLQDFITKNRKRPMKGWHERFFSLSNGCLSYGKNYSMVS